MISPGISVAKYILSNNYENNNCANIFFLISAVKYPVDRKLLMLISLYKLKLLFLIFLRIA